MRAGAALAVAVLLGTGCEPPAPRTGRVEATADTTLTVRLDGRLLVLDGFAGTVALATDAAATVATVRLTRRARGATRASAAGRLAAITIREASDDELHQVVWRTSRRDGASVDVAVRLPPGSDVGVRLDEGTLDGRDLSGRLDAEIAAGTMAVAGVQSSVLRLRVGAGSVSVQAADVPPDARWHVRTGAGDVTVALPGRASVTVDARSAAGRVAGGLPLADVERSATRLRGRLGAGEGIVRAETSTGTVTLRAVR